MARGILISSKSGKTVHPQMAKVAQAAAVNRLSHCGSGRRSIHVAAAATEARSVHGQMCRVPNEKTTLSFVAKDGMSLCKMMASAAPMLTTAKAAKMAVAIFRHTAEAFRSSQAAAIIIASAGMAKRM